LISGYDGNAVIEVEEMWHIYYPKLREPVEAVKNANLRIREGEMLAIIGQNGAGKTTLIKHFNGLLKPSKGRVLVYGKDTRDETVAELSRVVGYVFQNPDAMIFQNTVREELEFGPRNLGMSPDQVDKNVQHVLGEFDLREYYNESPYIMSKAIKRRLTVASVLAMRPRVLVLDEPTIGQDRFMANKLMGYVRRLNESEKSTAVIVTHDMRTVAEFCERSVVMSGGELLYDGSTRNLFLQEGILRRAFLEPPQITQLSLRMKEYFDSPALSVDEVVAAVERVSSGTKG
jgi:energy-coupling factor transport system ATP-binding protein